MLLKKIKVGRWYETTQGIGQAVQVGGTFPPCVMLSITHPFPRGVVILTPRDVLKETQDPASDQAQ